MKVLSLLSIIVFFLSSCNQNFRSSLCKNYLTNIPESFIGTYKINMQQMSQSDFKNSGGQEAYLYLTKLAVLTSKLPTEEDSDIDQTNFCKRGDDILLENINSAGLYSYSLIRNNSNGLYLSPLVLQSNTNFNMINIPEVKVWKNGTWSSNGIVNLTNNSVVDNSRLDPSDVLPYLTTSSFSVFYERVKIKSSKKNIKWKVIKKI